ncbi:MAG: DUF4179 domain-containing protein [Clostridiales bacterium]|nr:DUF4179 domain-containing protein [Clostridiales bacterium]
MTMIKNDKDQKLREMLGQEILVSDTVNQKLADVYASIRAEGRPVKEEKARRSLFYRLAPGTAVAAVILAGSIFCVSNPALAAKLPLIGQLFAELGDVASFSGDYSEVGTALTENTCEEGATDEISEKSEISRISEISQISTSSDGITMTLSEVYCNEAALYLTLELDSEAPFENYLADENGAPILALSGTMDFSFNGETQELLEYLDGKLIDETTYISLLRIDLQAVLQDDTEFQEAVENADLAYDSEAYDLYGDLIKDIELPEEFEFQITVEQIIGDLEDSASIYEAAGVEEPTEDELQAMSDEEWESWMQELYDSVPDYSTYPNSYENYWYEGPFSFNISVTVDTEESVTIAVDKASDESCYVKSVTRTPFELYVSEVNNLYLADHVLVVLDADGKKLPNGSAGGAMNVFQTDGYDLTSIDLYSITWDDWESLKIKGTYFDEHETNEDGQTLREVLDENCLYHRTVVFE